MKKIYLIRHAETKSNQEGIFRGRLDIPLSNRGIKQTKDLKKYFSKKEINVVFSSPLKRSMQTSQKSFPEKNIVKEELLNNLDLGKWSGRKKEDIKKNEPEKWEAWINNPEKIKFPEGETLCDVYGRVSSFLKKINSLKETNIVIISHRSVLKILLAALLGLKKDYFWKFHLDNASVSILFYDKTRGYTIYKLNKTDYLKHSIMEWF